MTAPASPRQVLLDLADRVAGGETGFYIDKAILAALGFTWRGMSYWSADDKATWKGSSKFTQSIDSAENLLPSKEWNWAVERFVFDAVIPYRKAGAKASVWRDSRNPKERIINVEAPTPATALTAASLRARAEALP